MVLPDGSKRLIPASWTDLDHAAGDAGRDGPGTLGTVADLLGLSVLVSALSARSAGGPGAGCTKPTCQGG